MMNFDWSLQDLPPMQGRLLTHRNFGGGHDQGTGRMAHRDKPQFLAKRWRQSVVNLLLSGTNLCPVQRHARTLLSFLGVRTGSCPVIPLSYERGNECWMTGVLDGTPTHRRGIRLSSDSRHTPSDSMGLW